MKGTQTDGCPVNEESGGARTDERHRRQGPTKRVHISSQGSRDKICSHPLQIKFCDTLKPFLNTVPRSSAPLQIPLLSGERAHSGGPLCPGGPGRLPQGYVSAVSHPGAGQHQQSRGV